MARALLAVGVVLLGACESSALRQASASAQERERIEFLAPADSWPYPFSPAVRAGGFIFVSGQIGAKMENGAMVLVPGGIEPETRQTMDNVRDILARNGSSLDRVTKCTVMMADMSEWPRMNAIYATYFPGPKPARSALGANGLALGARVEIECIALV
jgi:reactive intermediate/imine deaminase